VRLKPYQGRCGGARESALAKTWLTGGEGNYIFTNPKIFKVVIIFLQMFAAISWFSHITMIFFASWRLGVKFVDFRFGIAAKT